VYVGLPRVRFIIVIALAISIRQRVDFKGFHARPSYFADDCGLVADARELRLRSIWACEITLTHSTIDIRVFAELPVPGYGRVHRHISEMQTYRTVGSGGH